MKSITGFIDRHYRHFNAAVLKDAADAYVAHLDRRGKMMITLAGAMSTAELGVSLAEMIRQDKVHAITCTGANLEEDLFNLVARSEYERLPNYRELSPQQEEELLRRHLNRVTDTCIPEEEAIRRIEKIVIDEWIMAAKSKQQFFPHEFLFKILRECRLKKFYEIDPADSWMMAAAQKNLPMFVPGWEDSTLGNIYAARNITGEIDNVHTIRSGIEYMIELANWYRSESQNSSIGFFQIGGGIAGDFPICVVPMLNQDVVSTPVPEWGYFCQISDSTTSYGSYSGAVPNEKITWG
ncbi:MAG TPA: deoxyhypusine synthase family protein, partial [Chthoniobacterales bacterium]|nr:deoxyhypusine synthase family protein [Chthoniobacterales bacterium]